MASLNLSINGPSIKSSYTGVVNGPPLTSASATYAQWALFSVQAPLLNAFQDGGAKESILKVESTGEGELADLIEDFNEGRIQFAFVKVKDPNTSLPKNVLIAWCGGGVPERTKGYFTSHLNAVAKVLHGYHVQITARSDSDLEPESIMQKVSDASGAKYSAGSSGGVTRTAPPPVKSKPVFTPTTSNAGRGFDPLVAARSRRDENVDEEGWSVVDAPPVTRTQIEKVESAYKPTKVNMAELTKSKPEPSRFDAGSRQTDEPSGVVRGAYQPVGKVDIAAIRAAAQNKQDDRPAPVKGAYEPVGKVDIAAIRARSQKPADEREEEPAAEPKPLAERAAAFSQPSQAERITSMPKPRVANKFGGPSTFTGTRAPAPGGLGLGGPAAPTAAPVGAASRTFADQGGKTPAQLWAERKANQGGSSVAGSSPAAAAPVTAQKSGGEGWRSGYTGKSWAPVQTTGYARDAASEADEQQHTGDGQREVSDDAADSASGVSALRDRFKNTSLIGSAPTPPGPRHEEEDNTPAPPPVPGNSRPSGGFALPGLPSRPPPADEEEEEADPSSYELAEQREPSPIRVAAPVARAPEPEPEAEVEPEPESEPEPEPEPERRPLPPPLTAQEPEPPAPAFSRPPAPEPEPHHETASGGHRAVVQYDYEKAEGNEIDLIEGQIVINIDMVDEDWWMGTNHLGESGLFPSNYVELVEEDASGAPEAPAAPATPPAPESAAREVPSASAAAGPTATALYDYEAAEDNELSFPEDAQVTNLEFPDEDWWFGHYNGHAGLFPSNYVQLDS